MMDGVKGREGVEWKELKYSEVLKEVESGDNSAKTKLAWLKLSGLGGAEVDEDGAVVLLEERVKDRDGDAMWMLGVCCEYGMGIEQDIERANDLYDKSSKAGSVIGKFLAENGKKNRGKRVMNVWSACGYENVHKTE